MAIDLTQRKELSGQERYEISVLMHYALLEGIFRSAQWRKGNAVFHGGTSLKVNWMSPRFSEDLDFMVTEREMPNLDDVVRSAKDGMAARLMADLPNSEFAIKGERTPDKKLARYAIRWTHPKRIGRVLVKLEFFQAPEHHLAEYPSRIAVPDPDHETRIAISTPIIAAELESIMADKLVALAKRPYFKRRDVFDLWYTHTRLKEMGAAPDLAEMAAMSEQVGNIYGYDTDDLVEGLHKALRSIDGLLEDSPEEDCATALEADMVRWLPAALHEGYRMSGVYQAMVDSARELLVKTTEALEEKELDLMGGPRL